MKEKIKKIGIYKFESPIGRIYIGQSVDIDKRYKEHLAYKGDSKLQISFKLYGFLNHSFEIVEICDVLELNTRERHWQDFYSVNNKNGLNTFITRSQGKKHSSGIPKPRSYDKGELTYHEVDYIGMDLTIEVEFKDPKLETYYTGGFFIKSILHKNHCIEWALSLKARNYIKKQINRKLNYL